MRRSILLCGMVAAAMLASSRPASAANDAQIKNSINAAIAFLKGATVGYNDQAQYQEGAIALSGIALMEAGVPPDDPVIQNMAKIIRQAAVSQGQTYQIALDIIFLDKLGEDIDSILIQSLGARLIVGQNSAGGWSYGCPGIDDTEKQRLNGALQNASLKGTNKPPDLKPSQPAAPASKPGLAPEIEQMLRDRRTRFNNNNANQVNGVDLGDDNSNSQFAVLGLWAARRHGLPVDETLKLVEKRFRSLQHGSGGWGYNTAGVQHPTPSMTCAGLLAIAIGIGNRTERSLKGVASIGADGKIKVSQPKAPEAPPDPLKDRQVQAGFNYLTGVIAGNQQAAGPTLGLPGPVGNPGAGGNMAGMYASGPQNDLYFLWSLERVCMVYGVSRIGGRDWHQWGADSLVKTQNQNGSWRGKYGFEVETSFALMFLCRANLVKDLTRTLKGSLEPKLKPSESRPAGSGVVKGQPDPGPTETGAASLCKALVAATGAKQDELLVSYTEAKGTEYTEALADAVGKVPPDVQKKVRNALAERLARFSEKTLRARLKDENPELRRAAAIAAAMDEYKSMIPDLIEMVTDQDDNVVRGVRAALKSLTGKDLGPAPGASDSEKKAAAVAWKKAVGS